MDDSLHGVKDRIPAPDKEFTVMTSASLRLIPGLIARCCQHLGLAVDYVSGAVCVCARACVCVRVRACVCLSPYLLGVVRRRMMRAGCLSRRGDVASVLGERETGLRGLRCFLLFLSPPRREIEERD